MPNNLPPYLFALSAGFVYTISALLAKRGLELGAGTFRSLVYSNWVMALFFVPYPMLAQTPLAMEDLKAGGMIGILFFAAQSCCFIALRSGDASMVTPIMGSKSVFVALFLFILNLSPTPLGPATWTAAILAAIAVALIGWPARGSKPSLMGLGFALATAAGFGLVDALVPQLALHSRIPAFGGSHEWGLFVEGRIEERTTNEAESRSRAGGAWRGCGQRRCRSSSSR